MINQPSSRRVFFKSLGLMGAGLAAAPLAFQGKANGEESVSTPGIVDAFDYGAVPDADQDSHDAIQQAINNAGIGDKVYLRPGEYYLGSSLTSNNIHGVTLDFAGTLKPYGSFTGYLLDFSWAPPNPRPLNDPAYPNYPTIHIDQMNLDGNYQCRGLSMHRYDHFLVQRVMMQRMGGTGLRVRNCREADFVNVTNIKSAGGLEPNLYIDDKPIPGGGDGSNNLRFYGLQSVYNSGQALKIKGGGPDNACRNLCFYGVQFHYLDADLAYGTVDPDVKLVEIVTCQRAHFFGGNMRTGKLSAGTALTIGDPLYQVACVTLNGVNLSVDAPGSTALNIVNAKEVYTPSTQFTLLRPTQSTRVADPKKGLREYVVKVV